MVALAQLNPNTLKPPSSLIRQRKARPVARRRVTEKDRDRMVELYQAGQDAREVAEQVGMAKSTVLRTLRARGVEVRPWGVKY